MPGSPMPEHSVAIVGMACLYPDARSPAELWENILAQRRAFRRFPRERLDLADYYSPDRAAPDRTYGQEAALIEGYQFDRVRFRVGGSAYRAADLTHWLALDIAERALADAGFPEGRGLPREATGVLLGNTLTGEFSRASVMRLRWPFVRRVAEAALAGVELAPPERRRFLETLGERFKDPFAPIGEDSLAGGLANTIAGRICNYFDFKGGGYTVDGACSSSLLAVANGCSALVAGDLDVAIVGGVDLSLDPFELVGFAKAGALSAEDMRIYDRRPAGFLPGEGCGIVVLMRLADAVAQGRRIWATVRGWGISSDGHGGLTRPEVEGQLLALRRAYRHTGFGPEAVGYFEGHGTGTAVGDACELQVLSRARREADPTARPAAVGSIKATIGHTKAAAGVAGLIKATLAVYHRVVPPTVGCESPHTLLSGDAPALRVLARGEDWPDDGPARAAVSSMGFGGINAHIVLEGTGREATPPPRALLSAHQDAELLLIDGADRAELSARVGQLVRIAAGLSRSDLSDLAAHLALKLGSGALRAAVVASRPAELAERLGRLADWLAQGVEARLDVRGGIFLGSAEAQGRIGLLFPGQGAPTHPTGGAWARRFAVVQELYADGPPPGVQPGIVTATLAGLRVLARVGIAGEIAVGHSLGELVALHWSGAIDEPTLRTLVAERSRAMDTPGPAGGMASLRLGPEAATDLIAGTPLGIAGFNSPQQTVVSGPVEAIAALVERCHALDILATPLKVERAFHSPLVAPAAEGFARTLAGVRFAPPRRPIASTRTGDLLAPDTDLADHLTRQIVEPVRFSDALARVAAGADLLIEVGPGRILSGLAADGCPVPCIALDAGGASLGGLLLAVGAVWALGQPLDAAALFTDRFTRPFDPERRPLFLVNPCELVPRTDDAAAPVEAIPPAAETVPAAGIADPAPVAAVAPEATGLTDTLALVRALVAARVELPTEAVEPGHRLLSDLHLNSITVGQLVAEAARQLGCAPPAAPGDYADATVAALAEALAGLAVRGPETAAPRLPEGIDAWIRPFAIRPVARPLTPALPAPPRGWKLFAAEDHPLAATMAGVLDRLAGRGVICCLTPPAERPEVDLLLAAAQAAGRDQEITHFVLVQRGGGASGLARTLHLEAPRLTVVVVDLPFDRAAAARIEAEVAAAEGFVEAIYGDDGVRSEPEWAPIALAETGALPLGPADVLLVTGGGKGIASECALALATASGAALAIVGRSDPARDAELAANLERLQATGVRLGYCAADVTDPTAVRQAVAGLTAELGTITALLHSAGTNVPRLLTALDGDAFARTLAPKLDGLRNVLAALDPESLRLVVAFGSIIARSGMPGNADYAVANEWLALECARWSARYPHCRTLSAEWSVWSGLGMGERLGKIASLVEQGITPIPPATGAALLLQMLATPDCPEAVVVSGRFGGLPTVQFARQEIPFRRFLESPRVHTPFVELVADSYLSRTSDPYVADHVFGGEALLPAVFGLEAMLQAAMAVSGYDSLPVIEQVRLERPIVVPPTGTRTVRVAALVQGAGVVEVAMRSDETGFAADHFRAVCRFAVAAPACPVEAATRLSAAALPVVPGDHLYGGLLFHSGRFCRLQGYRHLRATECFAEIGPARGDWFDRLLPAELLWGDPGARDAALHGIQACIPHATLLPTGVDRIVPVAGVPLPCDRPLFFAARERERAGNRFTYDLEILDGEGTLYERWEGLRLQLMVGSEWRGAWPAPLLAPYIERRVQELNPGLALRAALDGAGVSEQRLVRSNRALAQVGATGPIRRRPDGRPEPAGPGAVSVAHAGPLTLAVGGDGPIGCDLEPVRPRPEGIWLDLLGQERFALAELIVALTGEGADAARTRVWSAVESLKKAGLPPTAPLTLLTHQSDGWVVLAVGKLLVATFVAPVAGLAEPLALAVLAPNATDRRPFGVNVLPCLDRL